jgi:small basic protein (TIGR04137 family)
MSLHSSLRVASAGKRHRSVLKRFERVDILKRGNKWKEDDSVFGLPKVKSLKIKKVKKEKAVEKPAPGTAAAPGAPAQAATEGTAKR